MGKIEWNELTNKEYTIGDSNWVELCVFPINRYFIGIIVFTIDNGAHKYLEFIPLGSHSISYITLSNYAVFEDIEVKVSNGHVYARTVSNTFHHDNIVHSVWGLLIN